MPWSVPTKKPFHPLYTAHDHLNPALDEIWILFLSFWSPGRTRDKPLDAVSAPSFDFPDTFAPSHRGTMNLEDAVPTLTFVFKESAKELAHLADLNVKDFRLYPEYMLKLCC